MTMRVAAIALLALGGCATPEITELRGTTSDSFILAAPLACVYAKAVEHASSYNGIWEPRFTWFAAADGRSAWLRQPLTIIDLRAVDDLTTQVERHQTGSGGAFRQGGDLLNYLRSNPCAPQ